MVGIVALVAVIGAVGVGGALGPASTFAQVDDGPVNLGDVEVSAAEAVEIAEGESDGTAVELEAFTSILSGLPVWEVEFVDENGNETEVYVDGTSGDVLNVETEPADADEADDEDEANASLVEVPLRDAVVIAEGEVDGGVAVEGELFPARVDGTPVWEVEVVSADGDETEVYVDATNGDVLDVQTESPDGDDEDDEEEEDD
ncbi:PepSY domain-containing protein [Halogeometricum limi]|uniref:PepSY domain-containing protein n=1 Tax=Halogeometricum limi TaxID=555875 RepID=UPI0015879661|nr:PepSY domain-containing protein [Halogeometricum limi]